LQASNIGTVPILIACLQIYLRASNMCCLQIYLQTTFVSCLQIYLQASKQHILLARQYICEQAINICCLLARSQILARKYIGAQAITMCCLLANMFASK